jgi:hypothetical protein
MVIIGVDYHPSFQAIAFCVEETGESGERELSHSDGQAGLSGNLDHDMCVTYDPCPEFGRSRPERILNFPRATED